ncbi:dj-1 family protein [Rhypophila decipiens]|uniref:Dj-1 family protein n=1 Tax=Rhypophila decipiens TaxID=261697 RepID=A0AAN6YBZ8_9PEZI|nr:dj-1 family protein [Rhypophila decipiens]
MAGSDLLPRLVTLLLFSLLMMTSPATAQNGTSRAAENDFNRRRTLSLGIIIFPGFDPLDVFGPLELFYQSSGSYKITLSLISNVTGPVSSGPPPHKMRTPMASMATPGNSDEPRMMVLSHVLRPSIVATHAYTDAPALDVLLVPGGVGTRAMGKANGGVTWVEEFINERFERLDYLLSVCTGSLLLARSGVLDGKRATTNKGAWFEVVGEVGEEKVKWVPTARWVVDGKIWTSSGVAAGMDMVYAFLSHLYGEKDPVITKAMNGIEYSPHTDPHWDPYSVVHKVPGANANVSLADVVKPVGYD